MNKVTYAERLNELIQRDGRIPRKADGEVNVTDAAKRMGIEQPTLQRALNGNSELPRRDNAEKMMRFFGVTFGQLVGTEAVEGKGPKKTSKKQREAQQEELISLLSPTELSNFIKPLVAELDPKDRLALVRMIASENL